jgi:FKBP-type peptidyl-prolyl cis-trans isomerase SlyD
MVGLGLVLTFASAQAEEAVPAAEPAPTATIQNNMDIGLEYTLTVEGSVVETTDGRGPFHYIHGQGQMIPGLERELIGLHVGDAKEVTVSPGEAYGEVDPAAFVEVPKDQLPNDTPPTVGMVLQGVNPDGKNFRAKINEVKDSSVVLDLNHPLAGKTLNFQVRVTDIKPSPAQ